MSVVDNPADGDEVASAFRSVPKALELAEASSASAATSCVVPIGFSACSMALVVVGKTSAEVSDYKTDETV